MKFRKKPVVIEATKWMRNGDHPDDYANGIEGFEGGELRTFTGQERRDKGWEGAVVRYYRHPGVPGEKACQHCGRTMDDHGWIDTIQGGHVVCPGDWIITDDRVNDTRGHGHFYPCKPDIFAATYEPAGDIANTERSGASSRPLWQHWR